MSTLINILYILIVLSITLVSYYGGLKKTIIKFSIFLILLLFSFVLSDLIASRLAGSNISGFIKLVSDLDYKNLIDLINGEFIKKFINEEMINKSVIINSLTFELSRLILRIFILAIMLIIILPLTELIYYISKIISKKIKLRLNKTKRDNIEKSKKFIISSKIATVIIGLIFSYSFLTALASPLNFLSEVYGLYEENVYSEAFSKSLPGKLNDSFLVDELYVINHNDKRYYIRNDVKKIDYFINLISYNASFEMLIIDEEFLGELNKLDSIDIIGSVLTEAIIISKLSNDEILTKEVIEEIYKINYKDELLHFKSFIAIYKLINNEVYDLIDIIKIDDNRLKSMSDSLTKMKLLNIIIPYYVDDINSLIVKYNINLEDLNLRNINYQDEIRIITELLIGFKKINIYNLETRKFQYSNLDPYITSNMLDELFKSKLFWKNSELLANYLLTIYGENPEAYKLISIEYSDLNSIVGLIKLIGDDGFFDSKDLMVLLDDESIEKIASYLDDSNLLKINIELIFKFLLKTSKIKEYLEIPDDIKDNDQFKNEMISLMELVRIFDSTLYKLEKKETALKYLDKLLYKENYSKVYMKNASNLIDYLNKVYYNGQLTIEYTGINWEEESGKIEFYNFIEIFRLLFKTELIYKFNVLSINVDDIDEIAFVLSKSTIIRYNITKIINLYIKDFPMKITVNECVQPDDFDKEEFINLINAVILIYEQDKDISKIIKLEDDKIEKVLRSKLVFWTLVKFICELGQDKIIDDKIIKKLIVVNLGMTDSSWEKSEASIGELRKLIRAIKLIDLDIKTSNMDINKIRDITTGDIGEDSDELSLILESLVMRDTLIYKIKELDKDPNKNTGYLIVNIYEEDWLDISNNRPGEIRNFLRAIKIIFPDLSIDLNKPVWNISILKGISDGTVDTNNDGTIDDNDENDLREICKSKILSDTIIFLIFQETKKD